MILLCEKKYYINSIKVFTTKGLKITKTYFKVQLAKKSTLCDRTLSETGTNSSLVSTKSKIESILRINKIDEIGLRNSTKSQIEDRLGVNLQDLLTQDLQ